jgi:glyoxylase-like metal-dependent hydrolase (beta-lactamase superfamily II)
VTYHGKVKPGGPSQVRELTDLVISKLAIGPMNNNAYLLRCRATGATLLIDAPGPAEELLGFVGSDPLAAVVLTHGHADHWQGLSELVHVTGVPVLGHADDANLLPVPLARRLTHGELVAVGKVDLSVVHLRGHTPGSIALAYDDPAGHVHLFTGDSLFPGGVGNTWGDAAAFASLIDDVTARIFDVYDDESWVYPGHGDDTVLGRERPQLQAWRDRGW